ncbi:hypothetical protein CU044_3337 [Streptomyces sp. L-9-10]|nr:hypothetical protein CU044_3337 [Streptomyces sp. L-9-10]
MRGAGKGPQQGQCGHRGRGECRPTPGSSGRIESHALDAKRLWVNGAVAVG